MRDLVAIAFVSMMITGCTIAEAPPSGQEDYARMCAACHGVSGRGDGPAAAGLDRRPADLTRLAARNGGTFPMLEVMARIDGYTSDTSSMPEFGAVFDGPLIPYETEPGILTPTPPRLIALAEYVESLQN